MNNLLSEPFDKSIAFHQQEGDRSNKRIAGNVCLRNAASACPEVYGSLSCLSRHFTILGIHGKKGRKVKARYLLHMVHHRKAHLAQSEIWPLHLI